MLMPSIFGESLFDDFFEDFARPARRLSAISTPSNVVMKTDIKETDSAFELDIDLPGYNKEDVTADLKDGYLTVSAKTKSEKDEKDSDGKFVRRERYAGSCSRSFYVGEHLNETDIDAKFENGVLKLSVPKKEAIPKEDERKYIAIAG